MAKKIRFPLVMADDTEVRDLDELREHFDLEAVLGYYESGKLLTWLRDRYLEDEADAVEELDKSKSEFQQQLCAIFGVDYTAPVDQEAVVRRQERLKKLRTFTDEEEFIDHIDQMAFDQEELADLLDEGVETIYLCGAGFNIPASKKNKRYIGVNSPSAHISGKIPDVISDLFIEFRNCQVDNLPIIKYASQEEQETKSITEAQSNSDDSNEISNLDRNIRAIQAVMEAWENYTVYTWANFDSSGSDLSNSCDDHCSKSRCKELARKTVRKVYDEGAAFLSSYSSKSISKMALKSVCDYAEDSFENIKHYLRMVDGVPKVQEKSRLIENYLDLQSLKEEVQSALDDELNDSYYTLYKFDYFLDLVEYDDDDSEMEEGIWRLFEKAATSYTFSAFTPYLEIKQDTDKYVEYFNKSASNIVRAIFAKRRNRILELLDEMK